MPWDTESELQTAVTKFSFKGSTVIKIIKELPRGKILPFRCVLVKLKLPALFHLLAISEVMYPNFRHFSHNFLITRSEQSSSIQDYLP